nr:hypothetical protein [Tanacetum cinerariifolium]
MNAVSCGLLLYFVSNVSGYPKLQVVQVLLLVVLVYADDLVSAGGYTLPASSYSFILLNCSCWSLLGSVHAYHDMAGHTKHFTTLRKLLYMVEKTDLQKLLGAVDEIYQKEEPDTFALLLWRLYPRAQVYVLETVDGRIIHMFVDVSYPLTGATLERMLKHRYVVPTGRVCSHSYCCVSAGK